MLLYFKYLSVIALYFSTVVSQEHPDTKLSITEILEKYGYPAETHEVVTEDGYILTIYRVPHGKNGTGVNPRPVLMQHGLFGMAENYVVAEMFGSSMAGYFADHGYDVWLGNARGNRHSRRHVRLDPEKSKFWDFSYHEIAIYDIPAMMDHMLKTTGRKKIYYIGHSQGGTVFFILNSIRPEYQKKFVQASLLAPAGLMKNFNNTLLLPLAKRRKQIERMVENAKISEFPPKWINMTELLYGMCNDTPLKAVCQGFYNMVAGVDSGEFYEPLLTQVIRFVPTVAARQPMHFAQAIESGRFRQYDYGKKKNLEIYGTSEPPDYPIEKIEVPVALYYGTGDTLVFTRDVEDTCSILPKCTRLYLLPNPKWTHLDFIFSKNLIKELHEPVLSHMDTFKETN